MNRVLVCLLLLCSRSVSFGAAEAHASTTESEISNLIADLGSATFSVREQAAQQLLAIGEPASPALQDSTHSSDPEIRLRARDILAKIGNAGADSVDQKLLAQLDELLDPVMQSSHTNLDALVQMGAPATPALVAIAKREDTRKSIYAMIVLTRIAEPRAFPALARLFQSPQLAQHMHGYVATIKDPRMIRALIALWQETGDNASKELRSQIAHMAGIQLEDDPGKWMEWYRKKYGEK